MKLDARIADGILDGLESDNDKAFFRRVFDDFDLTKYCRRLRAIGFCGMATVLDAGCGFGQWALCMGTLNGRVIGIDIDAQRIALAKGLAERAGLANIAFSQAPADLTGMDAGTLDGVFSYNAITLSPYRKTLREFHRILKPGGKLYFNAADLGWHIYNIIDGHNPAADFSSRQWSIETVRNTITYYATGEFVQRSPRDSLLIPFDLLRQDLMEIGFKVVDVAGDGRINLTGEENVLPFFPAEKYGERAVYEVLCSKI